MCCCIGEAVSGGLSLRIQQIDCRCETKTRDNVFVEINISVQYQIQRENLYDAFYKLTNSHAQITSFVFDEVRATVPKINLDEVFTSKEEIAAAIKEELTKSMAGFGFQILNVLVTDIEPAAKVCMYASIHPSFVQIQFILFSFLLSRSSSVFYT